MGEIVEGFAASADQAEGAQALDLSEGVERLGFGLSPQSKFFKAGGTVEGFQAPAMAFDGEFAQG